MIEDNLSDAASREGTRLGQEEELNCRTVGRNSTTQQTQQTQQMNVEVLLLLLL